MTADMLTAAHSLEAEMAVLGSMMMEKFAIEAVSEVITAEDFFREIHRHIYAAIMELYSADIGVDMVSLPQKLSDKGQLDQCGGIAYLCCLLERAPTAVGAKHYAQIMRQQSLKREIVRLATESMRQASEAESDQVEGVLETLKGQWDALGCRTASADSMRQVGELLAEGWEDLRERVESGGMTNGLPSGIESLDRITGGWQNGKLIVMAAWQSEGKSTLLLNWLCHLSCYLRDRIPTLLFSLEMDHQSLVGKILSAQSQVEHYRLRNPRFMQEADFAAVTQTCSRLYGAPLFIDDASGLTMEQIALRAKRAVRRHGVRCIAIDFIQHIAIPKGVEERLGYAAATIRAKNLAKELDVPVIIASQLSRKEKHAPNRRPRKSDLAETSALETYGDQVILLWHPDGTTRDGSKLLIVAKNRLGPQGEAQIYWAGDYQTFRDIYDHEMVAETSRLAAQEREQKEAKGNGDFSKVFTG